jgi:hypothetical protein
MLYLDHTATCVSHNSNMGIESITTPAYKRNILHVLDYGLIMYVRVASVYVNLPRRLVLPPIVGGKLVSDAYRDSYCFMI